MSKLSFRARALDTTKPMPILRAEDVPDLPDFAAINRAVPQMPTGMEKEEECEHHLQRAISAQQAFGRAVDHVIPTPEVFPVNEKNYDELYPATFKVSRAYIHIQLQSFEQEQPEYDMDSEDEEWFEKMKEHLNISERNFEEMIESLEKNSSAHKVIELNEAKALLKREESVVISVYDYWLNKKLVLGRRSLMPIIKTEKRDGSSGNNPYIAFRRRTEKMQTRKNRKNDESSYEKMLKLKRDFTAVRDLLGMVRNRESLKFNELKSNFEIYEKRYRLGDFNGQLLNEILSMRSKEQQAAVMQQRDKFSRILKNDENAQSRRKRDYKKRSKHDISTTPQKTHNDDTFNSSDDENANDIIFQGQINQTEEEDPDGQFAFKRKIGCNYHAPLERLSGWSWESPEEGGLGKKRFRFSLTSLSQPPNLCIGFARRRLGRGGRIIFDRVAPPFDDMDLNNIPEDWLHFKQVSPVYMDEAKQIFDYNSKSFSDEDFSDDPILRMKNEELLESYQLKYHENKLSNRANYSVNDKQHFS